MKVCENCATENRDSNRVCYQCYVALGESKQEDLMEVEVLPGARSAKSDTRPRDAHRQPSPGVQEDDMVRLLKSIELNTRIVQKNLAATRSIAIFIVGWVGWFLIGLVFIVLGVGLGFVPNLQILGVLAILAGTIVVIVGAVRAIANSLRELARSGD